MDFVELFANDRKGVFEMSEMATSILREYYDKIVGKAQNDYMLDMFQSESSIKKQIENGYRYFFVRKEGENLGFIAFYPKKDAMYLSKFYLYKKERGKGCAREILNFIAENAKKENLCAIELNVNKMNETRFIYEHLGFKIIRAEKNDIGNGYFMDDYVYRLDI
ncbi:MAG: GNAT family N-acetyltransferase [Clostridia bacterium]|nr:GNAT family N-acetyltransferase [Clostridia bacterium]